MTPRRSKVLSIGFLAFLIGVAVVGFVVARSAQDAVLASQAGSFSEYSLDPTEPGFRAFTTATPTALVIHSSVVRGEGAVLAGATLLAEGSSEGGGAVVTIPSTFVGSEGSDTLAELFRSEGLDAVTAAISSSLRIGFSDVVVLDSAAWTTLMAEDLPLQLTVRNDLVESVDGGGTRVLLEAGTRQFNLIEVARLAAHRNPDEPSLQLALRQQQIWQSWISRTAGAEERPELFAIGSGFVELIGSLANAEVAYRVLPTTTSGAVGGPASTTYAPDEQLVADLISRIVPFPEIADIGDRPSVLLLDTSSGEVEQALVVSSIVRAGAYVTVLGNAETGAERVTEVQLHDPAASEAAQEIADALGVGEPRLVQLEDATTAITVVTG